MSATTLHRPTTRTSSSSFFASNAAATASTTSCWDAVKDQTIAGRIAFVTTDSRTREKGYLLELAHRLLGEIQADLDKARAEYERDAAEDRANGHRPHYCIHGTDQWVDYDCACSLCEDSDRDLFATPRLVLEMALWEAKRRFAKADKAMAAANELRDQGLLTAAQRSDIFHKALDQRQRPWGI